MNDNNLTFIYLINTTLTALEKRHPGIIKEISKNLNSYDIKHINADHIGPIHEAQNLLYLNFTEHSQEPTFPRN